MSQPTMSATAMSNVSRRTTITYTNLKWFYKALVSPCPSIKETGLEANGTFLGQTVKHNLHILQSTTYIGTSLTMSQRRQWSFEKTIWFSWFTSSVTTLPQLCFSTIITMSTVYNSI